jgi:hypothetical protein
MLIRVRHDGTWRFAALEMDEASERGDAKHYAPQVEAALAGLFTLLAVLTLVDPLGSEKVLGLLDEPQETTGGLMAQYATADHGEPARMPPRVQ